MDAEQYLAERVQDQIDWHSAKAAANQRAFKWLQVIVIVAGALLPLLAGLEDAASGLTWVMGGIGVLIAALTGIAGLYRFNELWVEYRLTAESLSQEKYRFLTATAPYHEGDTKATLVERVEAILSDQNAQWQKIVAETESPAAADDTSPPADPGEGDPPA